MKGRYGLADTEKMFCADRGFDLFCRRGVDRERGCQIIVRPDQHIAEALPLEAAEAVAVFFDQVLLGQVG